MKTRKSELKNQTMKENMENIAKVFASDAQKARKKKGVHLQPTRKMTRAKIREMMWDNRQSKVLSPVAQFFSRSERRSEGTEGFVPYYNGAIQTYEEAYGVGYERFNNKYVQFDQVEDQQ